MEAGGGEGKYIYTGSKSWQSFALGNMHKLDEGVPRVLVGQFADKSWLASGYRSRACKGNLNMQKMDVHLSRTFEMVIDGQ